MMEYSMSGGIIFTIVLCLFSVDTIITEHSSFNIEQTNENGKLKSLLALFFLNFFIL